MVVLLWLLVLALDFPLFDIATVKTKSSMESRSFRFYFLCVYFLFFFFFLL